MEKKYKALSETKMSRKDFLQFAAGGVLVLFGVHNLITYLLHPKPTAAQPRAKASNGFGSSKFGV